MDNKSYEEIVLELLRDNPNATVDDIALRGNLAKDAAQETIDELITSGDIVERLDSVSGAVYSLSFKNGQKLEDSPFYAFFEDEVLDSIRCHRVYFDINGRPGVEFYRRYNKVPRNFVDATLWNLFCKQDVVKITMEYRNSQDLTCYKRFYDINHEEVEVK